MVSAFFYDLYWAELFIFCIFVRYFGKISVFIGRFILRSRLFVLLLAFVGLVQAQLLDMSQLSQDYMAENRINQIRVEGNQNMDQRSVLSRIGIRAGQTYSPTALTDYALIIQCGGCVVTAKQLAARLAPAIEAGVPVSNYGLAIAYMNGIFNRSMRIFQRVNV